MCAGKGERERFVQREEEKKGLSKGKGEERAVYAGKKEERGLSKG